MNIEALKSLQARIRQATGPDREIDWLILSNLAMPWLADKARSWSDDQYVDVDGKSHDPEEICWVAWEDGKRRYEHCPHWTTYPEGLGACVALMHERFPGCAWERSQRGSFRIYYGWLEHLQLRRAADAKPLANDCLTFIDAIIAATIAQLEAKETTHV